MIDWRLLAVSIPLLFVIYQSLVKLLPQGIPLFLVNAYASLIGAGIMLLLHFLTSTQKTLVLEQRYLLIALGIGALISLGNFGIIKALSLGAPQSLFTPIFYVALIVYGVIFGLLFWREHLNIIQIIGIVMAVVGLFLVAYFRK